MITFKNEMERRAFVIEQVCRDKCPKYQTCKDDEYCPPFRRAYERADIRLALTEFIGTHDMTQHEDPAVVSFYCELNRTLGWFNLLDWEKLPD